MITCHKAWQLCHSRESRCDLRNENDIQLAASFWHWPT